MKIKTFSRKTIAIAVAAGMSLGGVQVVSAQAGHDLSGQAVAAEAGTLDASVLTGHSVISSKSKKKVQDIESFNTLDGKDKFVEEHSDQFTFTADLTIPDNAKAGQTMSFEVGGAFSVVGQDGTGRDVNAVDDGFKMGKWVKQGNTVTFTLDKDASEYKNRKAHFEVPLKISPLMLATSDENKKDKSAPQEGTVSLASTGEVLDRFAYGAPYKYSPNGKGNISIYYTDRPLDQEYDNGLVETDPNLNTGRVHVRVGSIDIGSANISHTNVEGGNPINWPVGPDERRDVSVKYTIDNPNYKLVPYDGEYGESKSERNHNPGMYFYKGLDKYKSGYDKTDDKIWFSTHEQERYSGVEEIKNAAGIDYSVDIADDGQSAVVHFNNVRARDGFWAYYMVAIEGDYQPGDEVNLHAEFVDGVGQPHENYDLDYKNEADATLRFPDIAENASGDKVNIVKKAEMKALVNGKDANDEKSAEKITGGKGKFSIELKNTGTIGTTKATVKYPQGVKDAQGKTERVFDFGDEGFPPGKTKTLDLGELTVPNGAQENKFTVEMNGFESLSDPAWTNTAKTSDSVDPKWGNTEVPDGGTKKIPAGGGAKDAPKGTKYELTGDHPNWITIDGSTGEITANPPKGTKPGKNQVTVTTTFPDGSTDTDKPVITVIHNDVFIDGKPDVKPDGTVTLHRNDGVDITFKVPTGSKVEVNEDGDLVITQPDGKKETVPLKHTTVTEQGEPGTPDHKIIITDEEGNTHEFGTYDKFLESIDDNGKGTYTFIMNDGTKLGPIQLGDDITDIKDDGKGNLIVTHKDGSTETVPLKHTTVTETNKGKPGHTITITTPDGKKISFDAFDTYVTDVKKNDKGDYDIYRSDVNDGTTVWKTIVLSDIRGKISNLENNLDKLTEKQAADVKNLQDEIDNLEKEIEDLQGVTDDLDNRVSKLEANLTALTLRVTSLEKRVGVLEDTDEAWAKCYAGIGESAVPLALAAPLALMSDMNIPGLAQLNTQIQRTIGIYNPEAAKWMADNRGLFTAATGVLTFAGVVAMLAHTAKECLPYNKTPGVQDNMNPIIEGSSKLGEKIESGSSKPEGEDEDNGSSVDAGSSIGDGSSTDAGSSTAEGSSEDE